MIDLYELEGLDSEAIADILTPYAKAPNVKLTFSKTGALYFVEREELLIDYGKAAYVGQKLGEYASETTYSYVQLDELGDFEFVVPVNDPEGLADIVMELSYGFGNGDDLSQFDFPGIVEEFIEDVDAGKVIPFCPDLIELYHDLEASLDEDDDETD